MATKGKNKRRQLSVYDEFHNELLQVDSQEEVDFINWLNETTQLNIINNFSYQPDSYQLFDNVKYTDVFGKSHTLFRDHQYTTDFIIEFDPNKYLNLAKEFKISQSELSNSTCSAYIDVKGTFNRNSRSFSTDRKWMWEKFKIYIYELIPLKFFKLFGVPSKSILTSKTKQPRKCFRGFRTIMDCFSR